MTIGTPNYWLVDFEPQAQERCDSQASVIVDASAGAMLTGVVRTEPMAAVVLIALVAFGVVAVALYVVLQAIKDKKR